MAEPLTRIFFGMSCHQRKYVKDDKWQEWLSGHIWNWLKYLVQVCRLQAIFSRIHLSCTCDRKLHFGAFSQSKTDLFTSNLNFNQMQRHLILWNTLSEMKLLIYHNEDRNAAAIVNMYLRSIYWENQTVFIRVWK